MDYNLKQMITSLDKLSIAGEMKKRDMSHPDEASHLQQEIEETY